MNCQTIGCPFARLPEDTLCSDHRAQADQIAEAEERQKRLAAAWEHQQLAERGVVTPKPPEPPHPLELDKKKGRP